MPVMDVGYIIPEKVSKFVKEVGVRYEHSTIYYIKEVFRHGWNAQFRLLQLKEELIKNKSDPTHIRKFLMLTF